jgi:hypothetical protein
VDKQIDLLQGTLDMLMLKAVSLGPLHGYGFCCAFSRFQANNRGSSKARYTQHSIGWNSVAATFRDGARRRQIRCLPFARHELAGCTLNVVRQ